MITRKIQNELLVCASEYPVVTVLGPRQSGKTTLCQMAFPNHSYASLEDPDIRLMAENDPRGFLKTNAAPIIFDEIQRVPNLLSYIQGIVDSGEGNGNYILTGSHQLELQASITQSLAGRTAVLTLLPFSLSEIACYGVDYSTYELILRGAYPRLYENQIEVVRFYRNYLQTYIERDVRSMIQLKDLSTFQTFLRLLAGRIGQLINYSSLANDVGVSSTTIKEWVSILKASYVVFELSPYHANIRKRLVKSSKIYFLDMGLASYLLELTDSKQVERDPLRGNLFENAVILDVYKEIYNGGEVPQLYFYRDSNGNEVDLLVKSGRTIKAVEVKSSATFTPEFLKGINNFESLKLPEKIERYVVYGGQDEYSYQDTLVIPFSLEDRHLTVT